MANLWSRAQRPEHYLLLCLLLLTSRYAACNVMSRCSGSRPTECAISGEVVRVWGALHSLRL